MRKDKESRKNLILDTLNQEKKIKTNDLLTLLDVSPITLRKDLKELELEGLITRQPDGARGIIAGCTEIPLALGQQHLAVPYFDSLTILARAAILRAEVTPVALDPK